MEKQLPQGWVAAKLPEFTHVVMGQSPASETYNNDKNGLPFYQGKTEFGDVYPTVRQYCSKPNKIAEVGATLLSVRAPVGPTNLSNVRCCIGRGLAAIHPMGEMEPIFILLLFRSIEIKLSGAGTGSTFKAITKAYVDDLEFIVPPIEEQKRIVTKIEELFSELDAGIASLKKAREQLNVYRQAVLKHAFEGKLTAQWRADNAELLETPEQLLARIQTERETRYQQQVNDWKKAVTDWKAKGEVGRKPSKPSKPNEVKVSDEVDLPEIPKGWLWLEYLGICELIRNGISAKPIGDSGTKIFRISAVRAMDFNLQDIRFINNQDGKYDSYFLEKGDLVFTRYNGTRDYVGVCAEYKGDGTHLYPDKLIQTRVVIESIKPSYLEKAINCGASRGFIEERIRTTAGQSGVSGGDIKAMPVPICSLEEQKIIEVHLAAQLSYIVNMEAEIAQGIIRSETLRQSILKKAFSGQLVPQDPNDEPASELLARIQAEKAATLAEAKAAALAAKKAAADAAKRAKKAKTASGKKAVVSGTHKHGSS